MTCRCEFGWIHVSDAYPRQQHPDRDLTALPEDLAEIARTDLAHRQAAAANSWYPCKVCNPTLFFRWAGGHLRSDHDAAECPECGEIRRGKRGTALTLAAPEPPPDVPLRRDLDL